MKFFVPTSIAVVLLLIVTLGYFIFQNQKLVKGQNPSPETSTQIAVEASEKTVQPTQVPTQMPSPTTSTLGVQNAIKTSIASKNYETLIPYLSTPTVNFTKRSSDCCQPQTPQGVVEEMNYINEGVPFDFNQNSEVVAKIKQNAPELATYYIGISSVGEQTAAFKIVGNKITAIQLSVSYKLYDM